MIITVNGKKEEISKETTIHEYKKIFHNDCDVTIVNGFQTLENRKIKEGDCLTFIKKGKMPEKEELESMMAARHTPFVHEKVKKARVAVCGLGGLGSNVAVMLARTGVGSLLLIDFDIVEPSNLNRQSYYVRHLGMLKTDAVKEQLKEINPFIEVETKNIKIEEENIPLLFNETDIICEAFDNPVYKAVLINGVLECFPEKKIVSASGMAGFESSNIIKTHKRFKNLYVCGDLFNAAKEGMGLMAPRVSICAGHEANMILRLILGIEEV